MLIKAMGGLKG